MFVRLRGVRQISKTLNLMAGQGWVLISSNRSRCLYSDVANRSFVSCKQSLKQCYHLKFIDKDVGKVPGERFNGRVLCIYYMMPWVQFPALQTKTKPSKTEHLI